MKSVLVLLFGLLLTLGGLSGCARRMNVTGQPGFGTDYVLGDIYCLVVPLLVENQGTPLAPSYLIIPAQAQSKRSPDDQFRSFAPETIEDHERSGFTWRLPGVLPAGTRVRFSGIYVDTPAISGFSYAAGVVMDGRFAGKEMILDEISRVDRTAARQYTQQNHYLDPDFLRPCDGRAGGRRESTSTTSARH